MTRRERIINAMEHKSSDFPPYFLDFTQPLRKILADSPQYSLNYFKYDTQICGYNYSGNPVTTQENALYTDDFGIVWDRNGSDTEIGIVHNPVIKDFSLANYSFPVLDDKLLFQRLKTAQDYREDRFFMAGIGFSLFERAWSLCSMENLLLSMVVDEDFVHELFSKICDFNLSVLDVILDFDVDAVYFGDDWGNSDGLIMGFKNWKTFIKPYLSKMYNKVKQKNKLIVQHSCGNIEEVFPELIKMGVNCYQSFSPDVYNIERIKEKYGNDLCFWGGLSTQKLLTSTNPNEVISDIERNIHIMNRNGGFILSPTNSLTCTYPLDNIGKLLQYLEGK